MPPTKRSPLSDKPLRNPGQSLERQLNDQLFEKAFVPILVIVMMIWLVGMEWWFYFHPQTRSPIFVTILAAIVGGYYAFRLWRSWPDLKQLRQGAEGEKFVGQLLETLRENGYQVFHDLVGDDFNVDHVIIGPAGVFTIETKTISKPLRGKTKIQFDGETIKVNGLMMERNPIHQAKAQASWLKKILQETTEQEYKVRPVVVFPGWFIEQQPGSMRELWVLEPKALPSFLGNAPTILNAEQIKMASGHLSRFIRSQEQHSNG